MTEDTAAEGEAARVPAPAAGMRRGGQQSGPSGTGSRAAAEQRRTTRRLGLLGVLLALALLLSAQLFVVRMFHIPSTSMEPTLQSGDRVLVDLLVPGPLPLRRGDVVVVEDTKAWLAGADTAEAADPLHALAALTGRDTAAGHLAKRVVGLPGDRVQWQPGWEHVRVNGHDLAEPYLGGGVPGTGQGFDVTVPADRLWVLGDRRDASQDSRHHRDGPGEGFVDVDDVVGRVEAVAWPLDRIDRITGDEDAARAQA